MIAIPKIQNGNRQAGKIILIGNLRLANQLANKEVNSMFLLKINYACMLFIMDGIYKFTAYTKHKGLSKNVSYDKKTFLKFHVIRLLLT